MNHHQQIPRLDHLSSLISELLVSYYHDGAANMGRFTQGEIITILVGSKRKRFHIYKDLLRAKSPYFAASLKYCWNGDTDEVYLNEDANAFGHFTNWMFRGTVPVVDLGSPEGLAAITAFYKLADFLLVEDLRNLIMDAILKYLKDNTWDVNFFSLFSLREQNLRTTPLYKLFLRSSVRLFVRGPDRFEDGGDNDIGFLSDKPELMLDILEGVRDYNKKPWDLVWKCHRCEFHEHEESTICRR